MNEKVEIIKRTENSELHIDVPEMPVERLPDMLEHERTGFVHISHPNSPIQRNDV